MSWVEVHDYLTLDSRLIVPIGACEQYGPHLPIGAGTVVAEALADDLSRSLGVLRAPTLAYGVTVPGERSYPGAATLREKTLHRVLNDLLSDWEAHGFTEFVLITAQRYDPHVEAIATVSTAEARIRVVEALGMDLARFVDSENTAEHGGEVMTSLMLHLCPELVRMEHAEDRVHTQRRRPWRHGTGIDKLPAASAGCMGHPLRATADKGQRIYEYMLQRIRTKVFLSPDDRR